MSILWLATAAGAGMVFLTQVILARQLGPARYGLFASSLATVTMIAPLAGFGLSQFWLRVYGVEGWSARRWLEASLRFVVWSALLTIFFIAMWAFSGIPSPETKTTIMMLLPVAVGVLAVDLLASKFRLEDRYVTLAVWQMLVPLGRLFVAAMLLILPTLTDRFVVTGYSVIAVCATVIAFTEILKMLRGKLNLRGHGDRPINEPMLSIPTAKELWNQVWAYGLAAVLYGIFFQVSTVMLKYLQGDAAAGFFGTAMAVLTAIYLFPATIYQKFLIAKLHRWAVHDKNKFWSIYRKGCVAMLGSGVAVSIAMVLVMPPLVPLTFGAAFIPTVDILLVFAICPPVRFLSTAVGSALLSERQMRSRVAAMLVAVGITIITNLLLIPRFGAMGAAVSLVIGEAALLISLYLAVRNSGV